MQKIKQFYNETRIPIEHIKHATKTLRSCLFSNKIKTYLLITIIKLGCRTFYADPVENECF